MKIAERIVMVLLLLVIFGGAIWFYWSWQNKQKEVREAVARGDYEIHEN
jgi:lipopolysaccharide export system protein LptC